MADTGFKWIFSVATPGWGEELLLGTLALALATTVAGASGLRSRAAQRACRQSADRAAGLAKVAAGFPRSDVGTNAVCRAWASHRNRIMKPVGPALSDDSRVAYLFQQTGHRTCLAWPSIPKEPRCPGTTAPHGPSSSVSGSAFMSPCLSRPTLSRSSGAYSPAGISPGEQVIRARSGRLSRTCDALYMGGAGGRFCIFRHRKFSACDGPVKCGKIPFPKNARFMRKTFI